MFLFFVYHKLLFRQIIYWASRCILKAWRCCSSSKLHDSNCFKVLFQRKKKKYSSILISLVSLIPHDVNCGNEWYRCFACDDKINDKIHYIFWRKVYSGQLIAQSISKWIWKEQTIYIKHYTNSTNVYCLSLWMRVFSWNWFHLINIFKSRRLFLAALNREVALLNGIKHEACECNCAYHVENASFSALSFWFLSWLPVFGYSFTT